MKIPEKKDIPKNPSSKPSLVGKEDNINDIILDIKEKETLETKKENGLKGVIDIFNYINDLLIETGRVSLRDKLIFFQLLGATTHAGINITDAIVMIQDQTKNLKLKKTIQNLYELIEGGESLAGAMKRNDNVFDSIACAIVDAGERSGKLNSVLTELVKQYEQLDKIQKKVKGIMVYPMMVFSVMILLSAVVIIFVIPKLLTIFGSVKELPWATRVLQGASDIVIHQWFILLLGIIIIVSSFVYWKKTSSGSRQWAKIVLSIPIISTLVKSMIIARFTRIFGFLIASGVPLIEGLRISANITNNPLYEEKLLLASDDLTKGISIAENIADNEDLFPKMLINMISIGEKSASLETIMTKVSDYYQDDINRKVENLSRIMEPVILVVIAGVAVFFIMAIYLPILQMNEHIITK